MAHIIISSKRDRVDLGPGTEWLTLTTEFFASAVAQDHVLSVRRDLVDSNE